MEQLLGIGFAVLAALGLAVQSLAVRLGADTHSITAILAIVFAVNLLVIVPIGVVAASSGSTVTLTALLALAIGGLLGSLVGRACYFIGIARLGASRAEPLKALFPLVAVGGAVLVLDERVTLPLFFGMTLLVTGGIAVATETRTGPLPETDRRFWVSLAFPLLAALLYGVDPVFTKVGLDSGTSAIVGVSIRTVTAAAGFGVYLSWRALRDGRTPSVGVNRWLVVAGVANTVYLLAYFAALARTPVATVAPILGASTLFVVAGAALFLQGTERVTWRLTGATTLVVLGVALVVRA